MAIATKRNDTRNGTRQAHSSNTLSPKYPRVMSTTANATTIPSVGGGRQPAGEKAAARAGEVPGHVGNGAAVFAAQAQTLNHPQSEEEERSGQADRLVGWDQADHAGTDAHAGERDEERVLAAHP